jgi:hypothetical protein
VQMAEVTSLRSRGYHLVAEHPGLLPHAASAVRRAQRKNAKTSVATCDVRAWCSTRRCRELGCDRHTVMDSVVADAISLVEAQPAWVRRPGSV